jgi:hypothetical protein
MEGAIKPHAKAAAVGRWAIELQRYAQDISDCGQTHCCELPVEISLLIDAPAIAAREVNIGAQGIMPGRELDFVFSTLRGNDLIWPYVVNSYMKGRSGADPGPGASDDGMGTPEFAKTDVGWALNALTG